TRAVEPATRRLADTDAPPRAGRRTTGSTHANRRGTNANASAARTASPSRTSARSTVGACTWSRYSGISVGASGIVAAETKLPAGRPTTARTAADTANQVEARALG